MPYSTEFLLSAYRTMKTIREFEERCVKEFEGGNVPGFTHVSNGQEAIAVAACIDLSDKDIIGSTHRGHGHCIAKGCDVGGMMKEIMGRSTGLCKGKGGSMHIADIDKGMLGANAIVGGGPPLVNGAALAAKTLGTKNVALSFNGDGSANQGTVFETMILLRYEKGTKRPDPAEKNILRPDQAFSEAPEIGGLGPVFDQDNSNMAAVQKGMIASRKGAVSLASYQESRIRHLHQTIDKYLNA